MKRMQGTAGRTQAEEKIPLYGSDQVPEELSVFVLGEMEPFFRRQGMWSTEIPLLGMNLGNLGFLQRWIKTLYPCSGSAGWQMITRLKNE